MSKRGKRSLQAKERRRLKKLLQEQKLEQKQAKMEISRLMVLDFSWRDPINREVVFTDISCGKQKNGEVITYRTLLYSKLSDRFGGEVIQHALDHELGEVLNRFGV